MADPFSLAYDAIVSGLRSSDAIGQFVKQHNVLSYSDGNGQDVPRDAKTDNHLPQLLLVHTGSSGNLTATSDSCSIERVYQVQLVDTTGSITESFLPLEFAVFAAFLNLALDTSSGSLHSLEWEGHQFVSNIKMQEVESGESDPDNNRGIQGWASVWGLAVTMHLPISLLLSHHRGES